MEVSVIGTNHRTAPVHVREQVSLPGDLALQVLHRIRADETFEEALVLDTCNRTELYFVNPQCEDPLDYLLGHIGRFKGVSPPCETSAFYRHDGLTAVSHLFRVASSLDSQIVGEDEILGQVKRAYRTAQQARTVRFVLSRLLQSAFRTGKRVRTETSLGAGSASVPQAAVELARQIFSTLGGKGVLLVGAGQTGQLAARALARCGATRLIVANRTMERARRLASELLEDRNSHESKRRPGPDIREVRAVELSQIPSVITAVDLVICSTGSQDFVLRHEDLAESLARTRHPLLIVDIAVPRDVDPRLAELDNVFLYNIDELDCLVAENIGRRRLEIRKAEAIVRWEVEQFARWLDSLQVVPTIKLLQRRFELLQEAEIGRYGRKFGSSERLELQKFAQTMSKKILHGPISFLRRLSDNNVTSDELAAVELIRRIFDLDSLDQNE